jgi:hypothetical protein
LDQPIFHNGDSQGRFTLNTLCNDFIVKGSDFIRIRTGDGEDIQSLAATERYYCQN